MYQREGHSMITMKLIRRPPEARFKECRPCTHPDFYQQPCPWTIAVKLLTKSSWAGMQFLRHEPAVSPFSWQSNKAILFYVTQNSVSERFYLAPVHRGQVFSVGIMSPICRWGDWGLEGLSNLPITEPLRQSLYSCQVGLTLNSIFLTKTNKQQSNDKDNNTQRSRNLGRFLCLLWVSQSILYWPGAFFSLLESWLSPLPGALGGGVHKQPSVWMNSLLFCILFHFWGN